MRPHRILASVGAVCGTAVYVLGVVVYYAASRLVEHRPDAMAETMWERAELVNAQRA